MLTHKTCLCKFFYLHCKYSKSFPPFAWSLSALVLLAEQLHEKVSKLLCFRHFYYFLITIKISTNILHFLHISNFGTKKTDFRSNFPPLQKSVQNCLNLPKTALVGTFRHMNFSLLITPNQSTGIVLIEILHIRPST